MVDIYGSSQENTIHMSLMENYTDSEKRFFANLAANWETASGSICDKLCTFARFVPRQALATFLARERIFQKIIRVHGHIVECGVYRGAGLFSWSQLSSIFEPYNHIRKIVGFDTFEGFASIGDADGPGEVPYKQQGGLASHAADEVIEAIKMHDQNRPLGHLQRNELIIGDACKTIQAYIENNKHLVVALLYLDFDLYAPSKAAIEAFWPRMPKGAVIAFDELNQKQWPGETMALLDSLGIGALRLERFEFNPQISYAVKE